MAMGIYNNNSSATMANVVASASSSVSNIGILNGGNSASPLVMNNVTAYASGNAQAIISAHHPTIMNNVTANVTGNGLAIKVLFYDAVMTNIIANITGTGVTGISVDRANPTMTNVAVNAASSGNGNSVGIHLWDCAPRMTNVSTLASGGPVSEGIFMYQSSPTMSGVTAVGKNASDQNYGMLDLGYGAPRTIDIDRSTFEGATNSLRLEGSSTLRIGASKLVGTIAGSSMFNCIASYSGDYLPLDANCR
jgi:hypothetical protein